MKIEEAEKILNRQKDLYIKYFSKSDATGDWGKFVIRNAKIKNEEFKIGIVIYENDIVSVFIPYNKKLINILYHSVAGMNYINYEYIDRIIEIGF